MSYLKKVVANSRLTVFVKAPDLHDESVVSYCKLAGMLTEMKDGGDKLQLGTAISAALDFIHGHLWAAMGGANASYDHTWLGCVRKRQQMYMINPDLLDERKPYNDKLGNKWECFRDLQQVRTIDSYLYGTPDAPIPDIPRLLRAMAGLTVYKELKTRLHLMADTLETKGWSKMVLPDEDPSFTATEVDDQYGGRFVEKERAKALKRKEFGHEHGDDETSSPTRKRTR